MDRVHSHEIPSRDELASLYLDALPYEPYPLQEEALLTWFSPGEGILVCAPTGTGKTLIAEAAMFEALHTGKVAYYTTPLIALTEQKFSELQQAAVRWGFSADDVGLVTGNRLVNPEARVLVVVAEILLNRLLTPDFEFDNVTAVVMDEFHSFNDPERGVVWELSLALLPKHVRLMLLSATVGNSVDFLIWLRGKHDRKVQLLQGTERKVPLEFMWVGDELLNEQLEEMQTGNDDNKRTPALVFCFNRAECWSVAEQLKGKQMLADGQQKQLAIKIDEWDWKIGAGNKLKAILMRGVGVHHAGLLPKYRRRVEELFQQKLLSVCVCTETLAAGINLPARSVVMTSLVKGPPGKKKVIDASSAHQIFGRAGRPQFDTTGYVFALAHEDDVKIARWKAQYDQIPEDTKDPNLIRMKKKLKKKMPKRRENETYWNDEQFQKVINAEPANLSSKGNFPWRLLAYLLKNSPDVSRLRSFVQKRMMDSRELELADKRLTRMLLSLHRGGFVVLEPLPAEEYSPNKRDWAMPESPEAEALVNPVLNSTVIDHVAEDDFGGDIGDELEEETVAEGTVEAEITDEQPEVVEEAPRMGTFGAILQQALTTDDEGTADSQKSIKKIKHPALVEEENLYQPITATPTERLQELLAFRGCHPVYGAFLLDHLGLADRAERIQILESVLDVPGSVAPLVRVPKPEDLPPGPLSRHRIDPELMDRGLLSMSDIDPDSVEPELDNFGKPIRKWAKPLADKMKVLFDCEFPDVHDVQVRAVWIAGDLLLSGGDYQKYITTRDLTKQEGIIFRHLLRMILLCNEFLQVCPANISMEAWQAELNWIREELTITCRVVDPESTDKALEEIAEAEVEMGL